MEHLHQHYAESHERPIESEPPQSLGLSHFVHTLRDYSRVIALALIGTALAYAILVILLILMNPAQRITTQAFRLDFQGAGDSRYPNGTNFNVADLISGPIITRVYGENHLDQYIGFGDFSRSIFVLESNPQYEALAADYQSRLADTKLSPVDRERLAKEFDLKRQSIAKNEYAIHFLRAVRGRPIPEIIARKVLRDTLNDWADFAVNQQHVTSYQVSVLSPEILRPSAMENENLVEGVEVLRAKAIRVIKNLETIQKLPGANLVRTPTDRVSLEEVRLRLEEIVRFRLEPLVSLIFSSAAAGDRSAIVRFLESQLAYDQRQLDAAQREAEATRQSLALYEGPAPETTTALAAQRKEQPKTGASGSEAVMPQLSDSFLDRLIDITGRSNDVLYRQKLADDYRRAMSATAPLQQAVAYDTQVLTTARGAQASPTRVDPAQIRAQIEQARLDVGQMIVKMNELFQIVSRNMTPSTQLFAMAGPVSTRTLRAVNLGRFALYGVLLLLVVFPAIVVACLLHNRLREEEAAEAIQAGEASASAT